MASLSGKTSLSVGELADIVLAKQPTVTKLLGRMEEAGWVVRCDSALDKRQSLVSLTPNGQQKVNPLIAQAQLHERQVIAQTGEAETAQLKAVLEQMIAARS